MKILLDECVTRKLKKRFNDFEVYTVREMGYKGLKNGKLLAQAELGGFDILLTIDKSIKTQQNISKHNISIVILDVLKSGIKYFEPLIPIFISQMNSYEKGKLYFMERPQS